MLHKVGGLDSKSRMTRERHVRFCEHLGVKFPGVTRPVLGFEHEADAKRFLADMQTRSEAFD